jgi:hypothetical protein
LESYRESIKIIGEINDNIIIYKESFQKKIIQIFGADLKVLNEIELEFPKNQIEILQFILVNEKINILYAHHQKGKTYFKNKIIDQNYNQISDSCLVIADDMLSLNLLKVVVSENKNKLLVFTAVQGIQFYWFAFDLAENRIICTQTRKNYESRFKDYYNTILINNSGEIYFMIDNNNSIFRKNQHQVDIYSIKTDSFSLIGKTNLSNKLVTDYRFNYDEQNKKLNLIALYGENFSKTLGIFNFAYPNTDTDIKNSIVFEDSLIKNMTGKKRKNYKGIPNLIIKDVILRRDGGCILIAEQFFKYEYRMPSSPYNDISIIRNISYFYENVMVMSLNPDGRLLWREIFHKSQKSENDEGVYSSFFIMKKSGILRFLYNDQIQRSSCIYEFNINSKGISKRSKIFDNDSQEASDILPEFRNSVQISSNEILTIQKRYNKLRLIKIVYE